MASEIFDGPVLIVPGAMKAATSSLYAAILENLPAAPMKNGKKEPYFFSSDALFELGLRHYYGLFDTKGSSLIVDASTPYLVDWRVPERVASAVPPERLSIAISLRDPVRRLVSHYLYNRFVLKCENRTADEIFSGIEECASVREWETIELERASSGLKSGLLERVGGSNDIDTHPFGYIRTSNYVDRVASWNLGGEYLPPLVFNAETFSSNGLASAVREVADRTGFRPVSEGGTSVGARVNVTRLPRSEGLDGVRRSLRRVGLPGALHSRVGALYRALATVRPPDVPAGMPLDEIRRILDPGTAEIQSQYPQLLEGWSSSGDDCRPGGGYGSDR